MYALHLCLLQDFCIWDLVLPYLVFCCATADILTKLLQQCLFLIVVVIPGHNLGNSQVSVIGPLVLLWLIYGSAHIRKNIQSAMVIGWGGAIYTLGIYVRKMYRL